MLPNKAPQNAQRKFVGQMNTIIHSIVYVHLSPETDDSIFDNIFCLINCVLSFRNFKCVSAMWPGPQPEDDKRHKKKK